MSSSLIRKLFSSSIVSLCLLFAGMGTACPAQSNARALITEPISEDTLVALPGNVHPLAKAGSDLGAADASQPAGRLLLVLKRSEEQEADLKSFLAQAHQPGSPAFHQWIPAGKFGARFGAADSDISQLKNWLESHGLAVAKVSGSKTAIEFTGSIGQINAAFHTSIHQYLAQGETHYSNASAPMIPAALAGVVAGVTQLNDFRPTPQVKVAGRALYNPQTHAATPQWTYGEGQGNPPIYLLSPEDFATQYDVKPVYAAGINGAGQTIGIINESNIDISLVNAYRKIFGLPANPPQVVVDGNDPGINGAAVEAYLDVENAGAIAPAATVKLYTASSYGLLGAGGIFFSMQRAIDDDEATVLSLSFGGCEGDNSTAGNQFINQLYEQAAAQGQTVLVSSGDSGAAGGCRGLGVNGLASTPWNVSVGGTDFYFSDYASGGKSIANDWSAANDSTFGSLLKPVTEQPWDSSIYGLNSTTYDPLSLQLSYSVGGGGGASSCSVNTFDPATYTLTCISGYPKPAWQVGAGVPADGVRDLPDISLFASNAINGVIWPICAEAGDCTETDPSLNELFVYGVGGTSASTPAMAGIMALVNQKYGAQGQANYTLYPLAAQFPAAFHDITLGSNNELCYLGDDGCSLDTNGSGHYSFQKYNAGPGYDQASGLGTLDVNQLITNWSKITFKPSSTVLSVTPTTATHGQNLTVKVAVTGTGTPTGSVALLSTSTLPANVGQADFDLGTTGTATATLNSLPGGTYTVYGRYSGDGVNASSSSAPVTVTITPESSVTQLSGSYADLVTGNIDNLAANATVPFDSGLVLDVNITGATAGAAGDGTATGTVTFNDGSTVLGTAVVSSAGVAEFVGAGLAIGKHSITATYSGDGSYKASASAALPFTVGQQNVAVNVFADGITYDQYGDWVILTGQTVTAQAFVSSYGYGVGTVPTGTVTFQLGSAAPVTAKLSPSGVVFFGQINGSSAPLTLSNLSAGTYTLNVAYSGDANYPAGSNTQTIVVQATTLLPSTTKAAITSPSDPSTITPGSLVTLTATVSGNGTIVPTGTVSLYVTDFNPTNPIKLVPGANGTATATFTARAADLLAGNNVVNFGYSGDTHYTPSSSSTVVVVNSQADFSLIPASPTIVIKSGTTGYSALQFSSFNGFSNQVALTCAAPASTTCIINPSTVAVNSTSSATALVQITTSTTTTAGLPMPAGNWRMGAGAASLAFIGLLLVPRRRRNWMAVLLAAAVLGTVMGCGGSSTQKTTTTTVSDQAPGTYSLVVTGTAPSGTTHNTVITVIVQ